MYQVVITRNFIAIEIISLYTVLAVIGRDPRCSVRILKPKRMSKN